MRSIAGRQLTVLPTENSARCDSSRLVDLELADLKRAGKVKLESDTARALQLQTTTLANDTMSTAWAAHMITDNQAGSSVAWRLPTAALAFTGTIFLLMPNLRDASPTLSFIFVTIILFMAWVLMLSRGESAGTKKSFKMSVSKIFNWEFSTKDGSENRE